MESPHCWDLAQMTPLFWENKSGPTPYEPSVKFVCCFIAVNSYFTKYSKCDKIKGFYVEMIGLWTTSGVFE